MTGNRKRGWFALALGGVLALLVLALSAGSSAHWPPPGQTIAAGDSHSCTVREDNTLACWGEDSSGQVSETPAGEFLSVSAGGAHTCAIRLDNTLACWGEDSSGQVSETPAGEFASVSAGGAHTCAIGAYGALICWGDDSEGQASVADLAGKLHKHHNDSHHPHDKDYPPPFLSVAAGSDFTCGRYADGDLICWGEDSSGQVSEAPGGDFRSVSAGGAHACAVRYDGDLACWGDDSAGQVSEAPEGEFLSVAAGGAHTCAIRLDNTLACWGENGAGQVQPSILGPEPPEGTVGDPYLHVFETTPQYPHPVFGVAGGSLPDGLELAGDGTLSGTPTADGTFPFVLAAANGILPDAEAEETVKIAAPPPPPPAPVVQAAPEGLPPPIAGKTVNVKSVRGTVRIKCPGKEVAKLLSPEQIPIECLIDVRRGTVDLESSTGNGTETRSGLFWAGIFGVLQKAEDNWDTELRLAGRLKCEKRKSGGARHSRRARKKRKRRRGGRKLWGSGKGNFKTSGNYGSASVRGTTWLVVDRCDNSTLFKVREGAVWVRDFVKERTVVLTPGERYVAKAAIPRLRL